MSNNNFMPKPWLSTLKAADEAWIKAGDLERAKTVRKMIDEK